jgi:C-terminal processing protease CtpA/Prc
MNHGQYPPYALAGWVVVIALLWSVSACKKESSRASGSSESGQVEIVGVGLQLRAGQPGESVKVQDVVSTSPAAKAGIKRGFVLLAVDGKPTASETLRECVDSIRGQIGTQVRLQIVDPETAQTNEITLTREKIILATRQPQTLPTPKEAEGIKTP